MPNEPTEEMKIAGMEESPLCIKRMFNDKYTGQVSGFDTDSVGSIYKAMIEAAKKEEL